MTGDERLSEIVEVQQGEYRDKCAENHAGDLESALAMIRHLTAERDHYREQHQGISEVVADYYGIRDYTEKEALTAIRRIVTDLEKSKAAAVAAYDGNELVQAANHERDHYRSMVEKLVELADNPYFVQVALNGVVEQTCPTPIVLVSDIREIVGDPE